MSSTGTCESSFFFLEDPFRGKHPKDILHHSDLESDRGYSRRGRQVVANCWCLRGLQEISLRLLNTFDSIILWEPQSLKAQDTGVVFLQIDEMNHTILDPTATLCIKLHCESAETHGISCDILRCFLHRWCKISRATFGQWNSIPTSRWAASEKWGDLRFIQFRRFRAEFGEVEKSWLGS